MKAQTCVSCSCRSWAHEELTWHCCVPVCEMRSFSIAPLETPSFFCVRETNPEIFFRTHPRQTNGKDCSFLQGETVFIHSLLVCNINLSGTEECQHDPKTTATQWSSDKTLVVFKLESKEFQEGQISPYRWRHLLHHKLLLPWASSSILGFSHLFKSLRCLKQTSKAGLSCQFCYLSPLKAVMLLRGHRASGTWQECREIRDGDDPFWLWERSGSGEIFLHL